MGRETIIGLVLGVFGIAGSAAIGAILLLHPEWAGTVLNLSLAVCVLCVIVASFVIFWGVRKRRSSVKVGNDPVAEGQNPARNEGAINVKMGDNNKVGHIGHE